MDFIDWYRGAMTHHADEWMRLGRKYFPGIPVYLCTGGDADPSHGSNFADQCKTAAAHHGGIRITNETTDFGLNFACTNWVTTASHLYGNKFGFEPAGMVLDLGVVSRIYNAATAGVDEFMTYSGNIDDRKAKMDLSGSDPGPAEKRRLSCPCCGPPSSSGRSGALWERGAHSMCPPPAARSRTRLQTSSLRG